jgi:hypothetical protein
MPPCSLDTDAFYAVLESEKGITGLSWEEIAYQLQLDVEIFSLLSRGKAVEINALLTISAWIGLPLEQFTRGHLTHLV